MLVFLQNTLVQQFNFVIAFKVNKPDKTPYCQIFIKCYRVHSLNESQINVNIFASDFNLVLHTYPTFAFQVPLAVKDD